MRGDSIQQYLRFFGMTVGLVYLVGNQSFSQQFYVSKKNCIDDSQSLAGATGGSCASPSTFFDTDTTSTKWLWNFGDINATTSNVATIRNPSHPYTKVGDYIVTLTRTIGTVEQPPVTQTVHVGMPPTQPLFNGKKKTDTTVCEGKTTLNPYKLAASPPGATYLWFPKGQTTQTIDVDSSGCYSVEVFSPEGCSHIAQITVKYCLQQPNKPNKKDIWYFGDKGSLEFTQSASSKPPWDSLANSGTAFNRPPDDKVSYATKSTPGNILNSQQSMAMVFGPGGNLLFYTNGKTILTGDSKPVPALPPLTNTLSGDSNVTQSVLIVPRNACNECPHHQYYVFTENPTTKLLTYSVIDMRYNNQKGEIVEKDVPVYFPVGDRITGIKNSDETGFWIVTHNSSNNSFVVMKLDSMGLSQTQQPAGLAENTPESNEGYLHFSAKGDKAVIAVSKGGKNYVEIYKFDNQKGELQKTPLQIELPAAPPRVYGVEFSPDGEKLYVTLQGNPATGDSSFLYQLNLNLPDAAQIAASKIKIDSSATKVFGALQLDPNGQSIYMAVEGTDLMYSIQFPDLLDDPKKPGSLIGYDKPHSFQGTVIGGTEISGTSHIGLPNVIKAKQNDQDDGPQATYTNTCQNSTTLFEATPICSPFKNKYAWDFGDGTTLETDQKQITHKYTKPGKYKIKLTIKTYQKLINSSIIKIQLLDDITTFCRDTTLRDSIYIRPAPFSHLPDTVYVCVKEGASLVLDPKPSGGTNFTFLWRPTKETTPTITISAIGLYGIHIKNQEGCEVDTTSRALDGCEPVVLVPDIFTPNADGSNDKLQIISKYVTDYEVRIFNRWGEQVYYTDNPLPETLWDGTYKGYIYAPMNYAYVIMFKSKDFPWRPKQVKRGGILVVK